VDSETEIQGAKHIFHMHCIGNIYRILWGKHFKELLRLQDEKEMGELKDVGYEDGRRMQVVWIMLSGEFWY
jgi:hypothetical protein